MTRKMIFPFTIVVVVVAAILGAIPGVAANTEPYVFYVEGAVCVSYEGQLECFCPCQSVGTCEQVLMVTHTPGVRPTPTDVRESPTITNTPEPTVTSIPPTEVPTDEPEREHCDQGRGNGDDGCSPGNSDNQHEPNDPQPGPRR